MNPRTLLSVLALAGAAAAQTTIALEPSKDTAIFSSGDFSSGGGNLVTGHTVRFGDRRALVRFELGRIPVGSTIVAAQLEMSMSQTNSPAATTALHPLLRDWGEGTTISPGGAGAPADPGDATWNEAFFGSTAWQTPGGDFGPATASILVDVIPARYQWPSSPAMVAQVQSWLDQPTTNHGWLVITDESVVSARLWSSREFALPAERPVLTVDYIPPASVTPFGTGCVIQPFVPLLQAVGTPQLGNANFALRLSGVPAGLGLLFFSPDRGLGSFQGCTVFLGTNVELADLQFGGGASAISFPLAVPNTPSLGGLEFAAQSLFVASSGPTSTSNALLLRVGQ